MKGGERDTDSVLFCFSVERRKPIIKVSSEHRYSREDTICSHFMYKNIKCTITLLMYVFIGRRLYAIYSDLPALILTLLFGFAFI